MALDLKTPDLKNTACCILSLPDEGKTDCVLRRGLSVFHENLSSE